MKVAIHKLPYVYIWISLLFNDVPFVAKTGEKKEYQNHNRQIYAEN